ncbi:MAG: FtsX-like permease family protein [Gemmatimonadetes bacterium]|nr:FtsX-like permease family protein [Gemmatimonadota bacterium]
MRIESLYEGAALAIDQLRANKFRSGLTILGIVVGVAVVMAMSAMIQGIRSSVTEEMNSAGPNNFAVARFNYNTVRVESGHEGPPWGKNPPVTVAEARMIERLPAIRKVIVGLGQNVEMSYGRQRISSVGVAGRSDGWTNFTTGDIVAGHDFLPTDVRASAPVVVITEHLAQRLFGPLDPVGRTLRVAGQPFIVIGVFRQTENIFAAMQKDFAIAPYTTVIKRLDARADMLDLFVVVRPGYTQDEAIDQTITALRSSRGLRPGDPNNFAVMRQEEMLELFNKVTGVFFMGMLALSSVALMVGGVGVIAIMMIAVTERTREIGIRKAIGATKREILWQFLFESITVTFLGAAAGMLLGGSIA